MNISEQGLTLIKQFEGLRLKAYRDVVGVLTIGYGHTGPDVQLGQTIDMAKADALLRLDVRSAETAVTNACTLPPTQSEFDAMVSFAFNVGNKGMAGSSVIRNHNAGNSQAAARSFALWNKAGGKEWPGLTRRRAAEAARYLAIDGVGQAMPQQVDPERPISTSQIVGAGSATALVSGLSVAGQVAQQVADIRTSLGDWMPCLVLGAAVVAVALGLYTVWQRVQQRNKGWA